LESLPFPERPSISRLWISMTSSSWSIALDWCSLHSLIHVLKWWLPAYCLLTRLEKLSNPFSWLLTVYLKTSWKDNTRSRCLPATTPYIPWLHSLELSQLRRVGTPLVTHLMSSRPPKRFLKTTQPESLLSVVWDPISMTLCMLEFSKLD